MEPIYLQLHGVIRWMSTIIFHILKVPGQWTDQLISNIELLTMYLKTAATAHIQPATPSFSLDAAGLVALADLATVQERTALTGTSSLADLLILVPGLHLQQRAIGLNGGEYPACGALTSGYVFRVENPATVYYLQKVGRTGQLTHLVVTKLRDEAKWSTRIGSKFFPLHNATPLSVTAYIVAVSWAVTVIVLLALSADWWGLGVVGVLMIARLCNIIVIRRRSKLGWKGASEPGVRGDLLILLSQDRWIRMRGDVDDLKAVTSGQWLRDETTIEGYITAFATLITYLDAALITNLKQFGKILVLALLIGSVGLLAVANTATDELQMHGNLVKVEGARKSYDRRLYLAEALIGETKRDDWAVRMGMIAQKGKTASTESSGEVVM